MDPEARRFMWNVISRIATERKQSTNYLNNSFHGRGQSIITKIAIQVEGNLRCIGSVQHIKSKFGRGYEVEVKLEKPNHQEIQNLIQQTQQTATRLNMESTIQILKRVNQSQSEQQINMRGFGSHIYNDLRKPQGLSIETLAEFILIEQMGILSKNSLDRKWVILKLSNNSKISIDSEQLQEQQQVNYLYYLNQMQFIRIEHQQKQQLRISQYSIKQASIEQIFNKFATQVQPSDPNQIQILPQYSQVQKLK